MLCLEAYLAAASSSDSQLASGCAPETHSSKVSRTLVGSILHGAENLGSPKSRGVLLEKQMARQARPMASQQGKGHWNEGQEPCISSGLAG